MKRFKDKANYWLFSVLVLLFVGSMFGSSVSAATPPTGDIVFADGAGDINSGLLPAWRWSSGTSSLYTNYGLIDVMSAATSLIASALFSVSSFIWTIILGMSSISTSLFYGPKLASLMNKGWSTSYEAILGSGLVGMVIFLLLAGGVASLVTSKFRDFGLRRILSGLLFLGMFFILGSQAAPAISYGGATQTPKTYSPGNITLAVINTSTTALSNISMSLLSGFSGNIDDETDVLSCAAYQNFLKTQLWDASNTSTSLDDGSFYSNYLVMISDVWETSQFKLWKLAQFGIDNPYGDDVGCWYLESTSSSPIDAILYLDLVLPGDDKRGVDGEVWVTQYADTKTLGDSICVEGASSWWVVGNVFKGACIIADAVDGAAESLGKPEQIVIYEGEGEMLVHGTDNVMRRNMIGFAACRVDNVDGESVIVVNPGWVRLGNGHASNNAVCQHWVASGYTKNLAPDENSENGYSPWDFSSTGDISRSAVGSQSAQAEDFLLALNGHNGSAIVLALFSSLTALVIGFYLTRVTLGLLAATLISVVYGMFIPFMLLAAATEVPAIKKMGVASMRRWVSSLFASSALICFLTIVMITNTMIVNVISTIFGGDSWEVGGSSIANLVQAMLLSMSITMSFFLVTGFLKKNNMQSMYTAKGMKSWATDAYAAGNSQQAWQNHLGKSTGMGKDNSMFKKAKGLAKSEFGKTKDNFRENYIETKMGGWLKGASGNADSKKYDKSIKPSFASRKKNELKNLRGKGSIEVGTEVKKSQDKVLGYKDELASVERNVVSGDDAVAAQSKEIKELKDKIVTEERRENGLTIGSTDYLNNLTGLAELKKEELELTGKLQAAVSAGDTEGIGELGAALQHKRLELDSMKGAIEDLENGVHMTSKLGKANQNQRMKSLGATIPPTTVDNVSDLVESDKALLRAQREELGRRADDSGIILVGAGISADGNMAPSSLNVSPREVAVGAGDAAVAGLGDSRSHVRSTPLTIEPINSAQGNGKPLVVSRSERRQRKNGNLVPPPPMTPPPPGIGGNNE